ncbi:uncharacterized protein A4U43_C02F5710 [Asparagus officinalis]|uniref:DUF629 domain-containing protein n=1 Tax=Asparagus officinalis TaxID=4686 RepID=A0A5P1FK95_ASPOF|nr:uncharacterized protein A4U43_C02F5710 [Asparagus officinalis]
MWQHVLKEHLQEPSEELKSLFPKQLDQDWADKIVQGSWEPIEIHAKTANDNLQWPLSTDTERRNHLRRIKYNFWMLITNNCLSMSHIDNVLKYAMGEVQVLPSAQELQNVQTGDQLILSIRLLDSLQLKVLFDFLESLMKACKLGTYAESHGPSHDAFLDSPEDDIRIGVTLDDSFLYIDLDMKSLSSSENTSSPHDETWSPPDVNSIVCWLYEDQDLTEKIDPSTQRHDKAVKYLKKLENEYEELTLNCSQKCKLLEYQDALKCLKHKCENEFVETSASAESQIQCKKELAERAESGDDFVVSNSSDISTEEEAFEESRNRDGSVNQPDNNDENNSRTNSKNNSCINSAFMEIDETSNEKLCIADAKIMKNIATIRHLQLNFERACVINDRVYLIPLLRDYMKEALELRLIESEPHVEDSFTEPLHDDEENIDKREYSQKQLRETSRGKKKGSSSKKSKGRKSR